MKQKIAGRAARIPSLFANAGSNLSAERHGLYCAARVLPYAHHISLATDALQREPIVAYRMNEYY
jgi:hypothetical protein